MAVECPLANMQGSGSRMANTQGTGSRMANTQQNVVVVVVAVLDILLDL